MTKLLVVMMMMMILREMSTIKILVDHLIKTLSVNN